MLTAINPRTREALRTLRQFESKTILAEKYAQAHPNNTPSAAKLKSIAMTMRQGREFFDAAASSDYLTRPIQHYYGIFAYSRAMVMMLDAHATEDSLSQSHGLSVESMPRRIRSATELLNLDIKIIGGAFMEWANVAQSQFALRHNSSKRNGALGYDPPSVDSKVSIEQLLSLIPETWEELRGLTNKQYAHLIYNASDTVLDRNVWALDGKASQEDIKACFPPVEASKITNLNEMNWKVDAGDHEEFVPQIVQENEMGFNIGSVLIAPPIYDLRMCPLMPYYVASYAFSMLARYRPSIWGEIWSMGRTDSAYPVLERVMDATQDWYQYMLVENLILRLTV